MTGPTLDTLVYKIGLCCSDPYRISSLPNPVPCSSQTAVKETPWAHGPQTPHRHSSHTSGEEGPQQAGSKKSCRVC